MEGDMKEDSNGSAGVSGIVRFLRAHEPYYESYVAMVLLYGFGLIIFYNIVARTLWGGQLPGSLTIVLGMVGWMSWIAVAYGVRSRSHLRFTLIREGLSMRANMFVYVIEWVLWLIIAGVLVWFGIQETITAFESGSKIVGLRWPRWILLAAVPAGAAATIVRTIQQIVMIVREYRAGEDIRPQISLGE